MTARNMVTYNNNVGQIIANQAPIVIDWLKKYDMPYDELLFGKPHADFFVDDKGIKFTSIKNLKKQINL
jgi:capsule biosynthesis phosphatase